MACNDGEIEPQELGNRLGDEKLLETVDAESKIPKKVQEDFAKLENLKQAFHFYIVKLQ